MSLRAIVLSAVPAMSASLALGAENTNSEWKDAAPNGPTESPGKAGTYKNAKVAVFSAIDGSKWYRIHIKKDKDDSPVGYGKGRLDLKAANLDPADRAALDAAVQQNDDDNHVVIDANGAVTANSGPPDP